MASETADAPGPLRVGIVGPIEERRAVRRALLPSALVVTEVASGWEQVTLDAVRTYALHEDGAVLYAHTKGAANGGPLATLWRRSMTREIVSRWKENCDALSLYDAVACNGNFWIANCSYLRSLSPCPRRDREDAARWLWSGEGRILDRSAGWFPSLSLGQPPPPGSLAARLLDKH